MSRSEDNELHELTVDVLVARLQKSGRYDTIEKHLVYGKNGTAGEADVIATNSQAVHYYEVKCREHPHSFERAQKQFTKFASYCDIVPVRFIYVTPTCVKRVYLP